MKQPSHRVARAGARGAGIAGAPAGARGAGIAGAPAGARAVGIAAACAAFVLLAACSREKRDFRTTPPTASPAFVQVSPLVPGIPTRRASLAPYQENRWAVSEGSRLYNSYNCVGCHANGGGGIGPPLADRDWIYGSKPEQVFATITEGRPNGMPSFGGKLSTTETWRLVAYVRSLAKLTPPSTWQARTDHMSEASPEGR